MPGWFGKGRQCKEIISGIRSTLAEHRAAADESTARVKDTASTSFAVDVGATIPAGPMALQAAASAAHKQERERQYKEHDSKIENLHKELPELKRKIREIFGLSKTVKSVYIQVDDFYHLKRADQPHVMDYLHRLCKGGPYRADQNPCRRCGARFEQCNQLTFRGRR